MGKRWIQPLLCGLILLGACPQPGYAIDTSAASAVLIEQDSGRVIYAQNAEEQRLIASITKIMTALVALEEGELREVYTVTAEDMAEGSSMYLKPGEELELEELLYGLMLSSGNDAALAIAHCVAGDVAAFVDLMNHKAETLGMVDSHFANPNGLDAEGHYSTAADMAKLTACAMGNQDFCRIVSTVSITLGERYLTNHNKLLRRYEGCIGVKTGYTKAAGRTLVSAARRDGMTLICVTLSDGDDWNDHAALLDYGFANYRVETAAAAGQVMAQVAVQGGTAGSVPLILAEDLAYPVTGEEKITVSLETPLVVVAPIVPGQVLGKAFIRVDGAVVREVDLVASAAAAAREKE